MARVMCWRGVGLEILLFVLLCLQPFVGNHYEERHLAAHCAARE